MMSSRRRLRCIHHFYFFMVIIISELTPALGVRTSLNDEHEIIMNANENVISQDEDHANLFTTAFTPVLFNTTMNIYDSKDIMISTIKAKTDKFTIQSTIDSTKISTESSTPNYDPDISDRYCDNDSSNFVYHLRLKSIAYPLTSSADDNVTVEDFRLVNSTNSSLTVAWKPPKPDSIATNVEGYVLIWMTDENRVGCDHTKNDTLSYTIKNLVSCTKFDITVAPIIGRKVGHTMGVSVKTKTMLIVNNDTLKIAVEARGEYWLKIRWTFSGSNCHLQFDVTYCDIVNCKKFNSSTTYYNATDLTPCTTYNFTVHVRDESDDIGSVTITNSTKFKTPGPPTEVWTLAGKEFLNISWTPPFDVSCLQSYRVTISHDGVAKTENTANTNYLFSKLDSCSIYEVIVIAVGKNSSDSIPKIIQSNQTLAPIPQSPSIKLFHSTNDTIVLNWTLHINQINNCSNIEFTTECKVIEKLGHGYEGTNGTSTFNITIGDGQTIIRGLTPYTNYTCQSIASNSQGASNRSSAVSVVTSDYVPSAPIADVYDITNKDFTIKWDKPTYLPGELISFEIMFTWYYPFHRPEWCEKFPAVTEKIGNISGNISQFKYDKIKPYSKYNVKMKAQTRAGWGTYSDGINFQTLPGAPGPISNLKFFTKPSPSDKNLLQSFLTWGRPCLLNAPDIQYFNVTAIGERKNFPTHRITDEIEGESVTEGSKPCINDTCTYTFRKHRLKEEYNYKFFIAGKVANAPELGELTEITGTFPAGIPPVPNINYTNQLTIDPYKMRRTTTTASLLLPVFSNTYGDIRCYAIIVSQSGYNHANSSRLNLISGEWPDIASWYEAMVVDFKIPYQATKFCENLNSLYIHDYGKFNAVNFIIGDDTETCPELSSNQNERSYCNGPLKPDTSYDVRIRAFTNGGYRDSIIFTIITNAELQVAVVIGTIFGILFLGILITTMLLVRKCSIHAVLRRFLHSDMPGSPVPTPFNRRKFIAHCQELADNPGKLSNEFQLLQTLSVDLQMPTNAACLQANRKKNRYTDILPYDFSRVKLETIDNDPNSDYINASFIKGCNGDEEYIACQGPKEETTQEFWRMIDQYDVKLIVMLTQLIEKNKEKCHQYYPTIRETFTYENTSIRCSSELDYRTYTQRTLILQKENEKRTILHLHFKDWPDHDVPEDFDPMINFCQIMRRHIMANGGLTVIHCSAGIGRTGTLIAIDILLQCIKENRKMDVFGTVYRLRHHRINMVQRESQYAYIYNCIRQVLKNPYFSKSYKPPSVDPTVDNNSNNKTKTNSMTNLVSSLETLKKSRLSSSSIESVEQIYNSSTSTSSSSPKSSENCLLLHGLRFSKSTSAICSKPHQSKIVRYNTVGFSILKHDKEIERQSSLRSLDGNAESDNSISLLYEKSQQLNRFKLANITDNDHTVHQSGAMRPSSYLVLLLTDSIMSIVLLLVC